MSWSIRREASKHLRGGTKDTPRCIASWRSERCWRAGGDRLVGADVAALRAPHELRVAVLWRAYHRGAHTVPVLAVPG